MNAAFSWYPTWNLLGAFQTGMLATARHLKVDPDTMTEGTSAYGMYGIRFNLTALCVNFLILLPVSILLVHGCCNRRTGSTDISPDDEDNEDDQIKEER